MVPVPPMFLVPGEFAEAAALTELKRLRKSAADTSLSRSSEERALNDAVHADVSDILDKVDDNSFRLRCVAVLGSDLRHAWQQRSIDEDLDPVVRPLYLQTQLPRWVWVVEVHDREKQNAGLPSVIADILVDTTDFRGSFGVLAVRSRKFVSSRVVGAPSKLTSCLGPAAQSSLARLAMRRLG